MVLGNHTFGTFRDLYGMNSKILLYSRDFNVRSSAKPSFPKIFHYSVHETNRKMKACSNEE